MDNSGSNVVDSTLEIHPGVGMSSLMVGRRRKGAQNTTGARAGYVPLQPHMRARETRVARAVRFRAGMENGARTLLQDRTHAGQRVI